MNILFVAPTFIGDAVLSTTVLNGLLNEHKDATFTIASFPLPSSLFTAVPGLKSQITLTKGPYHRHWRQLWLKTITTRWDLIVDCRGSAFAYTLRGHDRKVWAATPEHRVKSYNSMMGFQQEYSPQLWTFPHHEQKAEDLLPQGPYAAFAPFAASRSKEWSLDNFQKIMDYTQEKYGLEPIVFVSPNDKERLGFDKENIIVEDDLLTVFSCLKRCKLFVGNDSGPMHLAATAGIPTLGLFGPTPEDLYGPWGPHTRVVRCPEPHEVLYQKTLHTQKSGMENLPFSEVLSAIEALMSL